MLYGVQYYKSLLLGDISGYFKLSFDVVSLNGRRTEYKNAFVSANTTFNHVNLNCMLKEWGKSSGSQFSCSIQTKSLIFLKIKRYWCTDLSSTNRGFIVKISGEIGVRIRLKGERRNLFWSKGCVWEELLKFLWHFYVL